MAEYNEPLNMQEQKKEFERLLESPAWGIIMESIQAQTDGLQQQVLFSPVESTGDAFRIERVKGQLEGRLSLAATVQGIMQDLEIDLQRAKDKE